MSHQRLAVLFALAVLSSAGCATVRRGVIQGTDRGAAAAQVAPPTGAALVPLRTAEGTAIVALFGRALDGAGRPLADAATRPTVLYFYPGGYTLQRSGPVFDGLRRLGCNVLIPEYPGFGMSAGRPTERGCYAAADAAWAWLQTHRDIDRNHIVLAGWSVGGGVAVDLAARQNPAGLMLIGTTTRLQDAVRQLADRRGSTAWIPSWFLWSITAQCRLDSVAKIPTVSCPTLIVYGERDELATKAMAERLAAAAKPGAKLVPIEAVGHGDFFKTNAAALWRELDLWLGGLPAPAARRTRSRRAGRGAPGAGRRLALCTRGHHATVGGRCRRSSSPRSTPSTSTPRSGCAACARTWASCARGRRWSSSPSRSARSTWRNVFWRWSRE